MPKGVLVFSLWRLDKSTQAGHRGNMMGQEVSNPGRHTVEMSVRHTASTTFHRAKHLFMSEQIGQSSNLFSFPWLQCAEYRKWKRQRERKGGRKKEREHVQEAVQFSSHESTVSHYKTEYWFWQLLQSYQCGHSCTGSYLPYHYCIRLVLLFLNVQQFPSLKYLFLINGCKWQHIILFICISAYGISIFSCLVLSWFTVMVKVMNYKALVWNLLSP